MEAPLVQQAVKLLSQCGIHGVGSRPFLIALTFAASAAFYTPIGYQTSILVMGPGHYRFADYFRAGAPLILILWIVFSLFAPWYYGL